MARRTRTTRKIDSRLLPAHRVQEIADLAEAVAKAFSAVESNVRGFSESPVNEVYVIHDGNKAIPLKDAIDRKIEFKVSDGIFVNFTDGAWAQSLCFCLASVVYKRDLLKPGKPSSGTQTFQKYANVLEVQKCAVCFLPSTY